jgi:hypothetical protein
MIPMKDKWQIGLHLLFFSLFKYEKTTNNLRKP